MGEGSCGQTCFTFGTGQRRLIKNCVRLVIFKHLCSNFCCTILEETSVSPDWGVIDFLREMSHGNRFTLIRLSAIVRVDIVQL